MAEQPDVSRNPLRRSELRGGSETDGGEDSRSHQGRSPDLQRHSNSQSLQNQERTSGQEDSSDPR